MVPCNTCFCCKTRKKSQATFRIDAHRRFSGSKNCFFVTLTYADEFLPYEYIKCDTRTGEIIKDIKSDTPILNPSDIVNFFKRYRRYSGDTCKYFYVGEYGDPEQFTGRPHWHIILHTSLSWKNCLDAVRHAWSVSTTMDDTRKGNFFIKQKYGVMRRSIGRITVSAVNMRRIRYCAKYVVKECNSNVLVPKFARWSKGYGVDWLKSSEASLVVKNKRLFAYTSDGKPASLSRYFTHRLYDKPTFSYLVDKLVFASLPPDKLVGTPSIIIWQKEQEKMYISQVAFSRINAFTPLHF